MARTWFRLLMVGCLCSSSALARDKHASRGHEHAKHAEAPKAAAPVHHPSPAPAPQPVHHAPAPTHHHSSSASHHHVASQPTPQPAPAPVARPVVPHVTTPVHHPVRHHAVEVARPAEAPRAVTQTPVRPVVGPLPASATPDRLANVPVIPTKTVEVHRPAPHGTHSGHAHAGTQPARPVAGPLPASATPDRLANVPVIPTKTVEVHRTEKHSHEAHTATRPSIGQIPTASMPTPAASTPVVSTRPVAEVGHRHETHGTHVGNAHVGTQPTRPAAPNPTSAVGVGVVAHGAPQAAPHGVPHHDSTNHRGGSSTHERHGSVSTTTHRPTHSDHHHHAAATHHSSSHHGGSSSFFIRLGSSNWNRDHFCHHHAGPAPVVTRTVVVPIAPPPQTVFVPTPVTTFIDSRDVVVNPPALAVASDLPPPERIVPTADEFALLSPTDQSRMLKMATEGLRLDLNEHENGNGWIEFLKLDLVTAWLEREDRMNPDAVAELAPLADRFEQVGRDEKLRGVSELIGFQILRVGLREVSLPPRLKTARAVRWMASDLAEELSGLTTSHQWRSYLRLDRLARLDVTSGNDVALREELALTLDRFERLTVESRYAVIWQKPAFDPLRQSLARLVNEPVE